MQIKFLISYFSKENNERITINDLIDANQSRIYRKIFLFNKKIMQKSFYIFMIGKFG
jgi:hypothetical protein